MRTNGFWLLVLGMVMCSMVVVEAAVFDVTNPAEFQNALDDAAANGEDDTINVASGIYNIPSTLTYSIASGDGSLTIQAQDPNNPPVLDGEGSSQIMSIDNDSDFDNDGSDIGQVITIISLVFQNGNALIGGGLRVRTSNADINIKDCFSMNSTGRNGGGASLFSINGSIILTNNTFSGNSATDLGGGAILVSNNGSITLTNNTFYNNSAGSNGGGIYGRLSNDDEILNIYNNIFWQNTSMNQGDDVFVQSDDNANNIASTVNLFNNNFSGNADFDSGQSEDLHITDTDNYSHSNNIQLDPILQDPATGDFHLQSTSPCIDAGDNSAPAITATDFEGDNRILNGIVDIGVDEFSPGNGESSGCSIAPVEHNRAQYLSGIFVFGIFLVGLGIYRQRK